MQSSLITTDLTSKLLNVALIAGKAIMRLYEFQASQENFEKHIHNTPKADGSLLTRADSLAHQIIVEALLKLTPGIPVVSEEDSNSWNYCHSASIFWLIDPLDGTKEFVKRNGEFTVNIALIQAGTSILGVIFAPALNLLYWGGLEIGAFCNRQGIVDRIEVNQFDDSDETPIRIVASRSHMNVETSQFIKAFSFYELIQVGSSLKFCRVAEGSADCYPRFAPTSKWDTAAAQAIVEAAGGYVCTMDGSALRYDNSNILNPMFIATAVPLSQLKKRLP